MSYLFASSSAQPVGLGLLTSFPASSNMKQVSSVPALNRVPVRFRFLRHLGNSAFSHRIELSFGVSSLDSGADHKGVPSSGIAASLWYASAHATKSSGLVDAALNFAFSFFRVLFSLSLTSAFTIFRAFFALASSSFCENFSPFISPLWADTTGPLRPVWVVLRAVCTLCRRWIDNTRNYSFTSGRLWKRINI